MYEFSDLCACLPQLMTIATHAICLADESITPDEYPRYHIDRNQFLSRLEGTILCLQLDHREGNFCSLSLTSSLISSIKSPFIRSHLPFPVDLQTVAIGMIANLRENLNEDSNCLCSGSGHLGSSYMYEEHDGLFVRPGATVIKLETAHLFIAVSSINHALWDAHMASSARGALLTKLLS